MSDRSSTPFISQASFVPFPPLPEELTSFDTSFGQYDSTYNNLTTAFTGANLSGYAYLAGEMDYRMETVTLRASQLVCADALTYIEKLTGRQPLTRRPREMKTADVLNKLRATIPFWYLREYTHAKGQYIIDGKMYADDSLALAAGKYIRVLKIEKNCKAKQHEKKTETEIRKGVVDKNERLENSQEAVERFLQRTESWCSEWLAGKIPEEDWIKMETFL